MTGNGTDLRKADYLLHRKTTRLPSGVTEEVYCLSAGKGRRYEPLSEAMLHEVQQKVFAEHNSALRQLMASNAFWRSAYRAGDPDSGIPEWTSLPFS